MGLARGAASFVIAAFVAAACSTGAHALSMKECSAKFKAAKEGNTLNGQDWTAFRAAQCGATPAAATAPAAAPTAAAATAPAPAATAPAKAAPAAAAASGPAVFPSVVSPKYANETAGRARLDTCLDQYKANKTTGANGGLHWIQKGGGYYSACSKHLKG